MRRFVSLYFTTESGRAPVREFVSTLHIRTRQAFFRTRELLEENGPMLAEPHCKKIDAHHGIYELRFSGIEGRVRIFYFFFDQEYIVFTNGFIKKRQDIPRNEIKTAIIRKRTYLER
ncbi:MAG TPA: type II toxin-antitoxin system RelE/ParE family toxin [Candidatus Omnitrophota bacterium]|nr:type II toxin-antitoxin system RelE/ParE family toxin [Candidatus Omnitrophota bacterium]